MDKTYREPLLDLGALHYDYKMLVDDRVGMLLSLKKLHQLYGAKNKLAEVERQLRGAGHNK